MVRALALARKLQGTPGITSRRSDAMGFCPPGDPIRFQAAGPGHSQAVAVINLPEPAG